MYTYIHMCGYSFILPMDFEIRVTFEVELPPLSSYVIFSD